MPTAKARNPKAVRFRWKLSVSRAMPVLGRGCAQLQPCRNRPRQRAAPGRSAGPSPRPTMPSNRSAAAISASTVIGGRSGAGSTASSVQGLCHVGPRQRLGRNQHQPPCQEIAQAVRPKARHARHRRCRAAGSAARPQGRAGPPPRPSSTGDTGQPAPAQRRIARNRQRAVRRTRSGPAGPAQGRPPPGHRPPAPRR